MGTRATFASTHHIFGGTDAFPAGADAFPALGVDGDIGHVNEATNELLGSSYLVVDTGPWIFGSKVLLPAGVVERVDTVGHKVYVDRTKDQIKGAPEYDQTVDDAQYRERLGGYYAETYNGPDTRM